VSPAPELEVVAWIASIDEASRSLARVVAQAGFDAPVPPCPDWRVRDLVQHLGGVHRWATVHVAEQREKAMPKPEATDLMASFPADGFLLEWFAVGHQALRGVLAGAPADLNCWSFLPAPSPLAFWARRQAHETEIHRADAELAAGVDVTPFSPEIAADGVAEMLFGFAPRRRRLELESEIRIELLPHDRPDGWLVQLGPDGVRAQRGRGDADCRVSGTTSELYLWLWNRLPESALEVDGPRSALAVWRRSVTVTWS